MFPVKIILSILLFLKEIFDKVKDFMEYFIEKYGCLLRRPNHSK